MTTIISDISALEYWRCPPIIRDLEVPLDIACAPKAAGGLGLDHSVFFPRANAREAERLIAGRLLTDLKALSLPIHVMVDATERRSKSNLVAYHAAPHDLPADCVCNIGCGLSVLTPEAAIASCAKSADYVHVARVICELCGTYALFHETKRSALIVNGLLASRKIEVLSQERKGWRPSFSNDGRIASIWNRPALTTIEKLQVHCYSHARMRGTNVIRRALKLATDDLASPLEAQTYIMLFAHRRTGGQALPRPLVNHRIDYTENAGAIADSNYAVADILWEDAKVILEVNGYAYHADKHGFYVRSNRTAALMAMGYTIHEITYEQLRDPRKFATIIESLSKSLRIAPPRQTAHSIQKEQWLSQRVLERTPLTG